LLFADDQQNNPDIPLDKWIFNTEAHPLPVRTHWKRNLKKKIIFSSFTGILKMQRCTNLKII